MKSPTPKEPDMHTTRAAVISDIHANPHALHAVFDAIDAAGIEEVWCLGDITGYGAGAELAASMILDRCSLVLAGNHDAATVGAISTTCFNDAAATAVRCSIGALEQRPSLTMRLAQLPYELQVPDAPGVVLAHGCPSPFDAVWDYAGTGVPLDAILSRCPAPDAILVGHSHIPFAGVAPRGREHAVASIVGTCGLRVDIASGQRLIANPGSVGQPRDADPRAAWLEVELTALGATRRISALTFHRERYDVVAAAADIVDAGLPAWLGDRLASGR
jgi:diadenosine tetraphosphatase ApaH/serine/threonine PP2A family protein phosphatase